MINDHRWMGEIEARMTAVEKEVRGLRDFRHDMSEKLLGPLLDQMSELKVLMSARPSREATGENRHLTMRDFYIVVGTLGSGWGIAQAFHLFK